MLGSILIAVNNYKQLISTLHTDANKIKKWPTIIKIMGLFILATIFILNGIPPTIYDTGLYHAQAISWLESYGVVPGLANIHVRFGTTSSWFQTAAIFGHSWTTQLFNTDRFRLFDDFSYIFHPINGYLFIILSIYLIQGIQKIPRHPIKLSNWVKLFILFFALYIFIDDIASPAPNTAIAFFTWWIFLLYLEKIEDSSIPQFDLNTFYVFFFSIFAISIKLSGVPLLLFPFALLLFSGSFAKKWRLVKLLILLSIV